nr:MAG TPA: hypothetical protein [Caudoviricetes sp.]
MAQTHKNTPDMIHSCLWVCPSTGLNLLYKQIGLAGSGVGSHTGHGLMVLYRV